MDIIRASLDLLDRQERRYLGLAIVVQMATSILDLLGVTLVGVVGAMSVATVQGQGPPRLVARAIETVGLGGMSSGALLALLSSTAAVLLLTKSLVSPLLLERVFRFLSRRETLIASRLSRELLARPLTFLQRRSSQELTAGILEGVTSVTSLVLAQLVVAASELALLVTLTIVLLVVNPPLALGAVAFFGLVGLGMQRLLGRRAGRLGAQSEKASVLCRSAVQEALGTYRELTVTDRRVFFVDRITRLREQRAEASAGLQMVNILPKYVSEGALVLGAFLLAAFLFSTESTTVAAGTFSLFLAAATRVMPSLIRLQTSALSMRIAKGTTTPTFTLVKDLAEDVGNESAPTPLEMERPTHNGAFSPSIHMNDVTFTYPGAHSPAIRSVDLTVSGGQSVALVGSSGAGKSTLADLILGVLDPDSGSVHVGDTTPRDAIRRWPGSIAYVPQDVMLVDDTVRANVALGLPPELIDDELVWDALARAQLVKYLADQPEGLDTQVGERGLRLSGGQRQRLGIARALYSRPRLLVLDEATSALDAETEQAISAMLLQFDGNITTVIIAHRLSTVRHAEIVVYLDHGNVLARGTFDEVCEQVPALVRQAALMGLTPN